MLKHAHLAVKACLHLAMALQGTYIASGTATAVVVATGDRTFIAGIARVLAAQPQLNAFDLAIRRIVFVFIAFILVMVPIVIGLNGWTTGAPFPAHSL